MLHGEIQTYLLASLMWFLFYLSEIYIDGFCTLPDAAAPPPPPATVGKLRPIGWRDAGLTLLKANCSCPNCPLSPDLTPAPRPGSEPPQTE